MRLTYLFAICSLVLAATSAEAGSMTFKLLDVNCPKACSKVLFGEGEIKKNSDGAFLSALRKAGPKTPVLLHSPGGDLMGGMKLGMAFRQSGVSVGVAPGGSCFSACAYALFGGVNRKVFTGGQLGIHEFIDAARDPNRKLTASEIKQNQEIIKFLNLYAYAMGVSPEVVGLAAATRYTDINVLKAGQMKRMRVTTGG